MNGYQKVERQIKKKEHEIQDLEAKIRDARVYIQAMQDMLKVLPRDNESGTIVTVLRAGSAMAKAREVILRGGQPVHIIQILQGLGKELTRENRASVSSSLAAYVRRGEIFTRTGPNIFGLIELGHKNEPETSEPPPDFGEVGPTPTS